MALSHTPAADHHGLNERFIVFGCHSRAILSFLEIEDATLLTGHGARHCAFDQILAGKDENEERRQHVDQRHRIEHPII